MYRTYINLIFLLQRHHKHNTATPGNQPEINLCLEIRLEPIQQILLYY